MGRVRKTLVHLRDGFRYGAGAWRRHFGRPRLVKVKIRGVGDAYIRTADSDFDCIKQVFSWHEYDLSQPRELGQRIEARYNALLESGNKPIIVDAGANIGSASLWFARHFPAAAIVAIEPDPDSAAVLRINVASRAVTVIEAAVGSERGHVELTSADASWGVQTLRADTGVRVVTIEDAFAESGGDAPFIVKVDIEGFESDLFARNLKWLDRAYAVIIEPHDWMMPGKRTSGSFQSAMASRPFELFIRGENLIYARI